MKLKALAAAALVAILAWYSMPARAQIVGNANSDRAPQTIEEFEALKEQVSNWGRWGDDDELGLLNLVTNEKRKAAAALVETGVAVSLAHTLITEKAVDTPNEPGQGLGPFLMENNGTRFTISFHSTTHSHIDAVCQFDYKGLLYNGYKISEVKGPDGCEVSDINMNKSGFTTRGILMDIPRLRGVPYLDPGTPVYPEDFDAWEKQAGFKVEEGDAIFLRTGRWQRRREVGPWNLIPPNPEAGEAGYHVSVIPWLHERGVAIIGADMSNDVRPSGVHPDVLQFTRTMPVHSLFIVDMGGYVIDAMDFEELSKVAAEHNRWHFMVTGAPTAAKGGSGSLLNLTAIF